MNIITVPYNSKFFYVRPDTSLNRDSNDYFCLDNINKLAVVVFIYVKISKAGKAISSKFANRYYSQIGTGLHIISPELINNQYPDSWWLANSLDNSTFLLNSYDDLSGSKYAQYLERIDLAIENISKFISLRTGDYITIELNMNEIDSNTKTITEEGKTINIIW